MQSKKHGISVNKPTAAVAKGTDSQSLLKPAIRLLTIKRFRGIKELTWRPAPGLNVILGGGDMGKTTILDAIALLLSPSNPTILSDTDYHGRNIQDGFAVEAVMTLPPDSGINVQFKPSWPWEWNGDDAVVPTIDEDASSTQDPVYRLRVRGTEDLELVYEIIQPDGNSESLTTGLRRAIGLVRLGGDDRNDRDLRLVHGSALDRLLSDKGLRSRMAATLAKTEFKTHLAGDNNQALMALEGAFVSQELPHGLDLAMIGGHGPSIASMVGLTALRDGVQLPLASWGTGTRRLSTLTIAEQNRGQTPVTVVDELERGLESYRQRTLVHRLRDKGSQVFATTHSPFVIAAGDCAAFWFVDRKGTVGPLDGKKIERIRSKDPSVFLSRLAVIAEGATEVGFVTGLLERALGAPIHTHGIYVSDGGSNETVLDLLEALIKGGLQFAGFADNENKHPTRWQEVADVLGPLLFQWSSGCIEQNIIPAVPVDKLEALLTHTDDDHITNMRLRTLADRVGIGDKSFAALSSTATDLHTVMVEAAIGYVPPDKKEIKSERKTYEKHAQLWFKSREGGLELEAKLFDLGVWRQFADQLLPFCNAVRSSIALPPITDLSS